MKFKDLDNSMRVFETAHDHCVLPGIHMVARLDGRSFTKLTKRDLDFEKPFDPKFRDLMVNTTKFLMSEAGFEIVYGYTESDEISLLLAPDSATFGRKLRKMNSVLAGTASAKFSLELGSMGVFDCRISQLPTIQDVADYFSWRHADSRRNSLNAHCYWKIRERGSTGNQANSFLMELSTEGKLLFLKEQGSEFSAKPSWQRNGIGIYWEDYLKKGLNPQTGEAILVNRRRLKVDLELPDDEYRVNYLKDRLDLD